MQPNLHDSDIDSLRTAIAALEGHRSALGDAVVELALAPLRTRLAALLRPVGLHRRQVAVLFVDVVGSTALAQVMQTEDTLDLWAARCGAWRPSSSRTRAACCASPVTA